MGGKKAKSDVVAPNQRLLTSFFSNTRRDPINGAEEPREQQQTKDEQNRQHSSIPSSSSHPLALHNPPALPIAAASATQPKRKPANVGTFKVPRPVAAQQGGSAARPPLLPPPAIQQQQQQHAATSGSDGGKPTAPPVPQHPTQGSAPPPRTQHSAPAHTVPHKQQQQQKLASRAKTSSSSSSGGLKQGHLSFARPSSSAQTTASACSAPRSNPASFCNGKEVSTGGSPGSPRSSQWRGPPGEPPPLHQPENKTVTSIGIPRSSSGSARRLYALWTKAGSFSRLRMPPKKWVAPRSQQGGSQSSPGAGQGRVSRPTNSLNLNQEQCEAAFADTDKALLIIAGAGSGKTTTLLGRLHHLVVDKGVDPGSVLVVTFTRDAANGMRSRLAGLRLPGSNRLVMCTFHSLCFQVLGSFHQEAGFAKPPVVYSSEADCREVMHQAMRLAELQVALERCRNLLGLGEAAAGGEGRITWKSVLDHVERHRPKVYQRALQAVNARQQAASSAASRGKKAKTAMAAAAQHHQQQQSGSAQEEGAATAGGAAERRIELLAEVYDVLTREALPDMPARQDGPRRAGDKFENTEIKGRLKWLDLQKRRGYKPIHFEDGHRVLYELYQERLAACGAVDFNDLLLCVRKLLAGHPPPPARQALRETFKYMMVDEYQDCNELQVELVNSLMADVGRVTVVGDDAQSIYAFRGADLQVFKLFEEKYNHKGLTLAKLTSNYRSSPSILKVAGLLLTGHSDLMKKELHPVKVDNNVPVHVWDLGTDADEADAIADEAQRLHREDDVAYEHMAALFRSTRFGKGPKTYNALQKALAARGIPYRIVKGLKFTESKAVQDVLAYCRLLLNPDDDVAFKRVHNTPSRRLGETFLSAVESWRSEQQVLAMVPRQQQQQGAGHGAVKEQDGRQLQQQQSGGGSSGVGGRLSLLAAARAMADGGKLRAQHAKAFRSLEALLSRLQYDLLLLPPHTALMHLLRESKYLEYHRKQAKKEQGGSSSSGAATGKRSRGEGEDEDDDGSSDDDGGDDDGQQQGGHGQSAGMGQRPSASHASGGSSRVQTSLQTGSKAGPTDTASVLAPDDDDDGDLASLGLRPEDPLRMLVDDAETFFQGWMIGSGSGFGSANAAAAAADAADACLHAHGKGQGAAAGPGLTGPPSLFSLAQRALLPELETAVTAGGQAGGEEQEQQGDQGETQTLLHALFGAERGRLLPLPGPRGLLPALLLEKLLEARGGGGAGPLPLREWMAHLCLDSSAEDKGVQQGMTICTIHAAKGLEWDTVFVPRCNDGFLPAFYQPEKVEDKGRPLAEQQQEQKRASGASGSALWESNDQKEEKHMMEEQRLAHVAATRAKERLYLTCVRMWRNTRTGKPEEATRSPFLKPCLEAGGQAVRVKHFPESKGELAGRAGRHGQPQRHRGQDAPPALDPKAPVGFVRASELQHGRQ